MYNKIMTRWIPIGERLPLKRGIYVTTRQGFVKRGSLIKAGRPTVTATMYDPELFPFDDSVLAWADPVPFNPDQPEELQQL